MEWTRHFFKSFKNFLNITFLCTREENTTDALKEKYWNIHIRCHIQNWVGENERKVVITSDVGTVFIYLSKNEVAHNDFYEYDKIHAKIYGLYIDKKHRKKGYGKILLKFAECMAIELGEKCVAIEVEDDGPLCVGEWFKRNGYIVINRRRTLFKKTFFN